MRLVCKALALLLLAGCATVGPVIVDPISHSKGDGTATVIVLPPDLLNAACQRAGHTIACVPLRTDDRGVTILFRTPPESWGLSEREVSLIAEVFAHELCHEVFSVVTRVYRRLKPYIREDELPADLLAAIDRFRRDSCHDEDGGRLHNAR